MKHISTMQYLNPSNRLDSLNALNELILLHKKGILTDDEFERLVKIASTAIVESEFENRIMKAIEEALLRLNLETSNAR